MVFTQVFLLYERHLFARLQRLIIIDCWANKLVALFKLFLDNAMVLLKTLLKQIQVNLFLF